MKINFKKLSKHTGYQSLKKSVINDCLQGEGCFNITGCNKKNSIKCFHRYCTKFKLVIDKAAHYSYKTGIDIGDILDSWENHRSYWYMNYYQGANQPKLTKDIFVFNNAEEFQSIIKIAPGFRCPACEKVTKDPFKCEYCNWKSYGLFGCLGKGAHIFLKEKMRGDTIFYPIAFEQTA